ncbi:MAG: septum site-determining protein MinD [Clostridia bacterium]
MRKIVVTSGKGGVGKTTVTATLGRKLADMNFRVVLVDGDVGLNNLDVVVGVESRVVYDIGDVLSGKCRAFQALVSDNDSLVKVLPSARDSSLLTAQAFRGVVDSLSDFDFVLIDCPAGIEHGFHRAVSAADEAIVVTTPSASAIRDADKVISLLHSYKLSDIGLVINRVRADMVARGDMMSATEIGRLLRTLPVGVVPEDDCITLYQQLGRVPDFAASDSAYGILAENIAKGEKLFVDVAERKHKRLRWI